MATTSSNVFGREVRAWYSDARVDTSGKQLAHNFKGASSRREV